MKICALNSTRTLLITLLIGLNLSLLAQDSLQIVVGTIRNNSNYEAISFAQVRNEMLGTKIIADEQGQYIIPVNRGDLLKITAIGYEDGFYIINDSASLIRDFPIQLTPRVYELNEFTITPYKTVMQFKHAVAQLKLREETLRLIPIITPNIQQAPSSFGEVIEAFSSPISFVYNTFSHKAKMDRKYNTLVVNDYKTTLILKRFKQISIAKIIPIKSDDEIDNFIAYCQFDLSFLLTVSDYELIAFVQNKYAAYLQSQTALTNDTIY